MDKLISIRKGGEVKRFHTTVMLRENTVASHSWGVAVILLEIEPNPSIALLKAALYHDVAEYITGDVSAVTKWAYPELAQALKKIEIETEKNLGIYIPLSKEEETLLKFCDMVDLVFTVLQEYKLGNTEAQEIIVRGKEYLEDHVWSDNCTAFLEKLYKHLPEWSKLL